MIDILIKHWWYFLFLILLLLFNYFVNRSEKFKNLLKHPLFIAIISSGIFGGMFVYFGADFQHKHWVEQNKISNNVIEIITFFVAIGVFWTLRVYYLMLHETEKTRKDQQMPVISFRFREIPDEKVTYFSHRLVNVGSGPALINRFHVFKTQIDSLGTGDKHIDTIIGASSVDKQLEIEYGKEVFARFKTTALIKSDKEINPFVVELHNDTTHYVVDYQDVFTRHFRTEYKNRHNVFMGPQDRPFPFPPKSIEESK